MRTRIVSSLHFKTSLRRASSHAAPAILNIEDATFYRQYPSTAKSPENPSNPAIFPNLTFSIPSFAPQPEHWAILGASSSGKTTFLEILRGQHLCFPPTARSYPYLNSEEIDDKDHRLRIPARAIQYVGFNNQRRSTGGAGATNTYLSARYESRREATDFSLLDYLRGNTSLNPLKDKGEQELGGDLDSALKKVIGDLRLDALIDMPIGNLSNGQTRRAMIAKALLGAPQVLLLDEPFMGLDPPTLTTLSPLLHDLANTNAPRLVLALRPQDPLPDWITHVVYLGPDLRVALKGPKEIVFHQLQELIASVNTKNEDELRYLPVFAIREVGRTLTSTGIRKSMLSSRMVRETKGPHPPKNTKELAPPAEIAAVPAGEVLVQMEGVQVRYGEKQILGGWEEEVDNQSRSGLWWTVRRGERWGVFGPNGSGKTTILSLICSDHPQAYSLPIKLFSRTRLPQPGQPGISIFDIQARIGHSSPEIHAFFPRTLTTRQTLENAWSETFLSKPVLDHTRDNAVDACLRWFRPELDPTVSGSNAQLDLLIALNETPGTHSTKHVRTYEDFIASDTDWADETPFGALPFSAQRLALFLRALIKKPDLLILDEAFSGMDEALRDKCMMFLTWGETRWKQKYTRGGKLGQKIMKTRFETIGRAVMRGLEQRQALVCVSHVREEVPGVVREWMCLPEAGEGRPARFGVLRKGLEVDEREWMRVWGMR